jgi:hypothetical protein
MWGLLTAGNARKEVVNSFPATKYSAELSSYGGDPLSATVGTASANRVGAYSSIAPANEAGRKLCGNVAAQPCHPGPGYWEKPAKRLISSKTVP